MMILTPSRDWHEAIDPIFGIDANNRTVQDNRKKSPIGNRLHPNMPTHGEIFEEMPVFRAVSSKL
jgi:hypothetical protein